MTSWTVARQASLSIANSWSSLKLMSTESVMPSNHLILCRPLLLPPSIFPSIRVFSNEYVFKTTPSVKKKEHICSHCVCSNSTCIGRKCCSACCFLFYTQFHNLPFSFDISSSLCIKPVIPVLEDLLPCAPSENIFSDSSEGSQQPHLALGCVT